jgi:hypothetical protein
MRILDVEASKVEHIVCRRKNESLLTSKSSSQTVIVHPNVVQLVRLAERVHYGSYKYLL